MFAANSTMDLTYSFHYSKLSCWKPFYAAHIFFSYMIFFSGIACLLTRVFTRLQFLHSWMGKFYIMFMLWGTATSLLIHNTGLPIGVLWSFCWVLNGLCFGWIAIAFHQKGFRFPVISPIDSTTGAYSKGRDIAARLISLKGFHGCIMFVSWINIAGRIFVTPPVQDFTCYTYPAYKPISNDHYTYNGVPFELVENVDPKYNRLPWANKEGSWAATMLFAPFFGAIAVGMLYLYFTLKDEKVDTRASHAKEEEMITKALVPESKPATPSSSAEPADAPPGRKKSQKKKVRDGH